MPNLSVVSKSKDLLVEDVPPILSLVREEEMRLEDFSETKKTPPMSLILQGYSSNNESQVRVHANLLEEFKTEVGIKQKINMVKTPYDYKVKCLSFRKFHIYLQGDGFLRVRMCDGKHCYSYKISSEDHPDMSDWDLFCLFYRKMGNKTTWVFNDSL
ncbi:MAG: hypothetical protein WC087_03245 [Candidatus Paceibacterota bacterium]